MRTPVFSHRRKGDGPVHLQRFALEQMNCVNTAAAGRHVSRIANERTSLRGPQRASKSGLLVFNPIAKRMFSTTEAI
ncbi:hypothetical protein BAE36_07905 [Rhizobium leguminosarum bv. trifolii]|jgi:hypothetical protein|nr:hypothetical protein BAE36_07905 [Rhizobium leguminosarum bv. trifolii]